MFRFKVLITFLFISVLIVDASPASRSVSAAKFSLNFATRVNATGIVNIAHSDRARAKALYEGATSIGVTNVQVTYVAQIAVGDPATECKRPVSWIRVVRSVVAETAFGLCP